MFYQVIVYTFFYPRDKQASFWWINTVKMQFFLFSFSFFFGASFFQRIYFDIISELVQWLLLRFFWNNKTKKRRKAWACVCVCWSECVWTLKCVHIFLFSANMGATAFYSANKSQAHPIVIRARRKLIS